LSEKVEANPKLKEALGRVLEATKGTPRFLELVREFHITDQDPALLEIAVMNPGNSTGVEAARLILASRNNDVARQLARRHETPSKSPKRWATRPTSRSFRCCNRSSWIRLGMSPCADRPFARSRKFRKARRRCSSSPKAQQLPDDVKLVTGFELSTFAGPTFKTEAWSRWLRRPAGTHSAAADQLHVVRQLLCFGELEQRRRAFLNLRERANGLSAQGDIPSRIHDDRLQQRNDLLVGRVAQRFGTLTAFVPASELASNIVFRLARINRAASTPVEIAGFMTADFEQRGVLVCDMDSRTSSRNRGVPLVASSTLPSASFSLGWASTFSGPRRSAPQ